MMNNESDASMTLFPLWKLILIPEIVKKIHSFHDVKQIPEKIIEKSYCNPSHLLNNSNMGVYKTSLYLYKIWNCLDRHSMDAIELPIIDSSKLKQQRKLLDKIWDMKLLYQTSFPSFDTISIVKNGIEHQFFGRILEEDLYVLKIGKKLNRKLWGEYMAELFLLTQLLEIRPQRFHLVLPLYSTCWTYELERWDPIKENRLSVYLNSVTNTYIPPPITSEEREEIIELGNVGSHVSKSSGSLVNTFIEQHGRMGDRPFQIFLNGNLALTVSISEKEIEEASLFLKQHSELKPYCHFPYTIALSNIDEKTQRALKSYLSSIQKIGIKGGVVHVGKSNLFSVEESIENMRQNIIASLEYASISSPLLLETPAGQGKELLTKKEDFVNFIKSIEDDRFGCCLDTCHVFATGYLPSDYLFYMEKAGLTHRLKLIHFNDSKCIQGSCLDRHAPIGSGYIPKEEFLKVISFASIHQIPMVIE